MKIIVRLLKHPLLLALALTLFEAVVADLRRRTRKT